MKEEKRMADLKSSSCSLISAKRVLGLIAPRSVHRIFFSWWGAGGAGGNGNIIGRALA